MTLLAVLAGFIAALMAPWLTKHWRTKAGLVLSILPFFQAVYFLFLLLTKTEVPLHESIPWGGQVGL